MRKIVLTIILSLIFLTGFTMAAGNCAPVGPPKLFYGNVYYNDSLISGTYTINAMMGGTRVGSGEVINGKYGKIQISPCEGISGQIDFIINGVEANEKGQYIGSDEDWGAEVNLNLTLNNLPPSNNPCGNPIGTINPGEECDGTNLAGRSVNSCGQGWVGIISCSSTCEINYSNCTYVGFCGDNVCNNGESCSTCAGDCGACPITTTSPSSGGGGGGGGGSKPKLTTLSSEETNTTSSHSGSESSTLNSNENQETSSNEGISKITGLAIIDFAKTKTGKITGIVILGVIIIGLYFGFRKGPIHNSKNIKIVKTSTKRK